MPATVTMTDRSQTTLKLTSGAKQTSEQSEPLSKAMCDRLDVVSRAEHHHSALDPCSHADKIRTHDTPATTADHSQCECGHLQMEQPPKRRVNRVRARCCMTSLMPVCLVRQKARYCSSFSLSAYSAVSAFVYSMISCTPRLHRQCQCM